MRRRNASRWRRNMWMWKRPSRLAAPPSARWLTTLGYRNLTGPDGKKIIEPDPETAPLISRLFEWYAAGTLSLREAAKKVRAAGLVHRKSGAPVPVSTVHAILRNRLYAGEFEW